MCALPISLKGNGEMPVPLGIQSTRNNLLSKLPASELAALLELSTHVQCDLRDVLSATGQRIKNVYFPLTGMISLVKELSPRSLDYVVSFGERLSTRIIAAASAVITSRSGA